MAHSIRIRHFTRSGRLLCGFAAPRFSLPFLERFAFSIPIALVLALVSADRECTFLWPFPDVPHRIKAPFPPFGDSLPKAETDSLTLLRFFCHTEPDR
jgi:hypothetical protein